MQAFVVNLLTVQSYFLFYFFASICYNTLFECEKIFELQGHLKEKVTNKRKDSSVVLMGQIDIY